jgi:hypothetical protein
MKNMRGDYISLKMEEFLKKMTIIADLKIKNQWDDVQKIIEKDLFDLVGKKPSEFSKLTEIGMISGLLRNGPTVWVPYKKCMLILLLKEAGDFSTVRHPPKGGYGWYLKALHLLLDFLKYENVPKCLEFLPSVELLLISLAGSSYPSRTHLLLMREYERRGLYKMAKNEFQYAFDNNPDNIKLLDLGVAFYERISQENDVCLVAGDITRLELESNLSKLLKQRKICESK